MDVANWLQNNWGWLGLPAMAVLSGTGWLLKRGLNGASSKADVALQQSAAIENIATAAKTAMELATQQMKVRSDELSLAKERLADATQAFDRLEKRNTDLQTIIRQLQSRHQRIEDKQAQLEIDNVRVRGDLTALTIDHQALVSSHGSLRADYEELQVDHRALWEYTLAWERAIEPEDGDTQARIKGRVDKERPANGHKH